MNVILKLAGDLNVTKITDITIARDPDISTPLNIFKILT